MRLTKCKEGVLAIVSGRRDLAIDPDARHFINERVRVVRVQKSGMVRVALEAEPEKQYAVAAQNLIEIGEPQ